MKLRCTDLQKGIACIAGGFLVHFSLGTIYTFGNMSPYIASYLKFRTADTWVGMGHLVWVFSLAVFSQALSMSLGGLLEKKIGTRITCLIGAWTMSFGVIMTYFAVKTALWAVIVTYGLVFGIGTGLVYSVALSAPMKWFPTMKGMVAGSVVAGYGLGPLMFNIVQTKFINPNNTSPNSTDNGEKFFDDPEVLDRVPYCFLTIGCTYAVLQAFGVLLLMDSSLKGTDANGEVSHRVNNEVEVVSRQKAVKVKKVEDDVVDDDDDEVAGGDSARPLSRSSPVSVSSRTNREDSNLVPNEDGTIEESKGTTYTNEKAFADEDMNTTPNYSVREAIKEARFWILISTFFCNGFVIVTISSLYKSFGQNFISDDSFFSTVGAVAAIFNAGGRIVWGQLLDRTSYRIAMTVLSLLMGTSIGTFYLCGTVTNETGSKAMFLIWVCLLFFCLAGSFALMPAATAQSFGSENMAIIYGVIFSGYAVSSLVISFISSSFLNVIHYGGQFIIATIAALISLFITQFFRQPALPLADVDKEALE